MKAANQTSNAGASFAERRSAPRFAFIAPIEVTEPLARTHISGRVTEISQYGCFAEAEDLLTVNSLVQLRIHNRGVVFESWAHVIHRSGIGVGLQFIDTASDQTEVLAGWLSALTGWLADAAKQR